MSGFLTSLAGLALGIASPGSARLSLPPRFAPVRDPGWSETAGEGSAAIGAPPAGPMSQSESQAAPMATPEREPPPTEGPPALRQAPLPERALTKAATEPPVSEAASERVQAARQVPREPIRTIAVPSARERQEGPSRAEERAAHLPALDPLPQRRTAETIAAVSRAPLSAAVVASRASIERDTRPVVHVTIDRIDVRAPRDAEKPEAAPKRAKAPPQISLADYLGARS